MSDIRVAWLLSILLVTIAGCGNGIPLDESSTTVVGFGDGCVYYQHYRRDSGFETLPSSLWRLDFDTSEAKRIQEATRQFGVQAEGDYYVTELVRDGETRGKIVSVQVSSGDRATLYERELHPAESDPILHAISGGRVVVLVDTSLLVFDVAEGYLVKTIELPADTLDLAAFNEDEALIRRGTDLASTRALVVDLSSEQQIEIPPAPGIWQPHYADAQITPTRVVLGRSEYITADVSQPEVLSFERDSSTWEIIAQYDAFDWHSGHLSDVFVVGDTDAGVIVVYTEFSLVSLGWTIERIDTGTGERHVIAGDSHGFFDMDLPFPRVHDGKIYWIDPSLPLLVVYDLATAQKEAIPIQLLN